MTTKSATVYEAHEVCRIYSIPIIRGVRSPVQKTDTPLSVVHSGAREEIKKTSARKNNFASDVTLYLKNREVHYKNIDYTEAVPLGCQQASYLGSENEC